MTKYTAWATYENGDADEYQGLTKSRALWRYHWFARQLHNNPKSGIKSYGWRNNFNRGVAIPSRLWQRAMVSNEGVTQMSVETIKITIKDATRIAEVIGSITEHDKDNATARAIVQALSWLLPENISASTFRMVANGMVLDLSGRNYVAEVKGA